MDQTREFFPSQSKVRALKSPPFKLCLKIQSELLYVWMAQIVDDLATLQIYFSIIFFDVKPNQGDFSRQTTF